MSEETLQKYGLRGKRVRVYTCSTGSGTDLVRVEWREGGRRVRESWVDSRENRKAAKAYGEGVAERLAQRATIVRTRKFVGEVVEAYKLANSHWRLATLKSASYRLKRFLTFCGDSLYIDQVTPELIDEFRAAAKRSPTEKTGKPMAPTQVAACAREVKALTRFAKARKLVSENTLADYKVQMSKDDEKMETQEYTNDQWAKVLAQLDPKNARQWRPYCLVLLAGVLGPRQKALRHLTWADVDLTKRTVKWRKEFDKMGKERVQPMPRDAVYAIRVARVWARRDGYVGPWLFYGVQERTRAKPYGYAALNYQLLSAEDRAGVKHIEYRAMHGLRRTSAGNVFEATGGNLKDAGDWIGDTDLKSLAKYLKTRDTRQQEVAGMVSIPATEQPTSATKEGLSR